MYSILIAAVAAVLAGWGAWVTWDWIWAIICGGVVFMICQLVIGLILRKQVMKVQLQIQGSMGQAQAQLNRKIQNMQQRPMSSVKAMQQMVEVEQAKVLRSSLEESKMLERFINWSPMMKRQIATMRMMLYYQLKDYAMVDELMPKCMLIDGQSISMKLARMYRRNDDQLEKFFKKKSKRLKGKDCELVYGVYAWIQVKRQAYDKAIAALIDAKKKCDSPVINDNYERLVNGKQKHFSLAGLGDTWYILYLEEPKVKPQRQQYQQRGF